MEINIQSIISIASFIFMFGVYFQILQSKAGKDELGQVKNQCNIKLDKQEFIAAMAKITENIRTEINTHTKECPYESNLFPKIDGALMSKEIEYVKKEMNTLSDDMKHVRESLHAINNTLQQIIAKSSI